MALHTVNILILRFLTATMPRTSATPASRMLPCSYQGTHDCSVLVPRTLQMFSPVVCELVGLPPDSRGQLCAKHSRIDTCSACVPDVCKHDAVDWFDSKGHPMQALTAHHCTRLNLDKGLVGSFDQVDQKSPARICTACRKHVTNLLSPEWRQRRYTINERVCEKAIYVKPAVHPRLVPRTQLHGPLLCCCAMYTNKTRFICEYRIRGALCMLNSVCDVLCEPT
jgi:hypothetical protein